MLEPQIDRVAIAVTYQQQCKALLNALDEQHFRVTVVDARGGFLQEEMVTLIAGMPRQRLPAFFCLVREHCPVKTRYLAMGSELPSFNETQVIEVRVGGATVFVVPVDTYLQL